MDGMKWALITGSSQGIGRAMAAECARRGLNLALVALPETGLPQVADELVTLYDVDVRYWEIDLCDHRAVQEMVGEITGDGLEMELLVNNAGIGSTAPFLQQDTDIIHTVLDLNVKALTVLTNMMLPLLQEQRAAHILNVASLAGC